MVAIWIADAQRCKRFYLQCLHMLGFGILDMIETKQVERTMYNQVRGMLR